MPVISSWTALIGNLIILAACIGGWVIAIRTAKKKLALAWTILPAPAILFIPAFDLTTRTPFPSGYLLLVVVAIPMFALMEGTAFLLFVKNRPVSIGSFVGCVLALGLMVLSIYAELVFLTSRM